MLSRAEPDDASRQLDLELAEDNEAEESPMEPDDVPVADDVVVENDVPEPDEVPVEHVPRVEITQVDEPDDAPEPVVLVRAERLTKAYDDEPVVRAIDFEVERGECLGILGPNGAGKTTTINMITCFVAVDDGVLEVFGHAVQRDPRRIKRRLGVVSQEDSLDPDLSVIKNLLIYGAYFGIPYRERLRRADDLLGFVQLEEKRNAHIRRLSGGMRRRLILARALISNPDLLVLDEPTTGLDPQARHVVWQKLRALKRAGVTMLLTTHYMEEAEQLCDRLLIMDRGEIIARGTPADLIEEHIGVDVIELFHRGEEHVAATAVVAGAADHLERAGDEVYGYFRDPEGAREILHQLGDVDFLHRRATLEDVFLRLTGRELRD